MLAPFLKMHGCGNDFVVFDERDEELGLTPVLVAAIADRRTGVGCDQVITLEPPPDGSEADVFMRIRNSDGSEAAACGNATRCVAGYVGREMGRKEVVVGTISGALTANLRPKDQVRVDMGPPRTGWEEIPLARAMDTLHLELANGPLADPAAASMGNPHATFFLPGLDGLECERFGQALEHDPLFPERANIGFAQVLAPDAIRLRVWERGAGLTRACGSGACAAVVNAHRRGLAKRRARVTLDGGTLDIDWRRADDHVLMTGPTATTFTGLLDLREFAR